MSASTGCRSNRATPLGPDPRARKGPHVPVEPRDGMKRGTKSRVISCTSTRTSSSGVSGSRRPLVCAPDGDVERSIDAVPRLSDQLCRDPGLRPLYSSARDPSELDALRSVSVHYPGGQRGSVARSRGFDRSKRVERADLGVSARRDETVGCRRSAGGRYQPGPSRTVSRWTGGDLGKAPR